MVVVYLVLIIVKVNALEGYIVVARFCIFFAFKHIKASVGVRYLRLNSRFPKAFFETLGIVEKICFDMVCVVGKYVVVQIACKRALALAVRPEREANDESCGRRHGADEHNCGKDERKRFK